jgi:hypothetical protein
MAVMDEYKFVYRTKTGTTDLLIRAETLEEAWDAFHETVGYPPVNGVYRKSWVAVD